jgi:SSS family solute:Na+ symporter
MFLLSAIAAIIFVGLVFSSSFITLHTDSIPEIIVMLVLALTMSALVAISTTYFIKYDQTKNITGLTAWSISQAKEMFKGSKTNDEEGKKARVSWKLKDVDEDKINFSRSDMAKMKANVGDLVYIADSRKWMGGLKSIHSIYGEPHNEDGVVYLSEEHCKQGQFVEDKLLTAEKEM